MKTNNIWLSRITKSPLFAAGLIFILLIITNLVLDSRFFSPNTLYGNLSVITPVVIATIAQSIVIISGSIDLSIGAAISLVNCILATTLKDTPGSVIYGLGISLVTMLAVGALNGVLVAYFKLPSMVATFAVSSMLAGVTLLVLPTPGGYIPKWLPAAYSFKIGGVLTITVFILIGVALLWLLIAKTKFGRYTYAVGGSESSAASSGINPRLIKFGAFIVSGVFIWLAAIIVTAQTGAGDFRLGSSYTMTTIAAAIMGGIALSGGKGKMLGAGLGACIMTFVINIIYFAGIQSFYQDMIRGLIVILALFIAAIPNLRKRTN